jgi:TolB-like protein
MPGDRRRNTIVVLEFENQRGVDSENDWYRKALQTAFNTELSKISQLKVIAPELLQRVADENEIDRLEAARSLGVERFIAGSFAVVQTSIRIDARIVDTGSGVQETAASVEGSQDEFFALQRTLARETLDSLSIELTVAEQRSLERPARSSVDKYRLLLEAEGLTTSSPGQDGAPDAEAPPAAQPSDGEDATSRPLLPFDLVPSAHAAPAATADGDSERAARALLESYRRALETRDLKALGALYVSFPKDQRRALRAYLARVEGLEVEFADISVEKRAAELMVSYTRRDRFTDRDTGEALSLEVRLTKFLRQDEGSWKFATEVK